MEQLGASVALDRPSSDPVFALALHSQFYFVLFVESKFRRKKISFFFSPPCFVSFSSFSLGFTVAWPILPPSKMCWKGAICGFPLLIYFRKTLQSDINCFDCVHLFIITGCCLTLALFFFPWSYNLALYSNICVQSPQKSQPRSLPAVRALKAETFRSHFRVGSTFHTYQAISCVQMGPSHPTLSKFAPPWSPSTAAWVGCRRFERVTFSVLSADAGVVGWRSVLLISFSSKAMKMWWTSGQH